MCSIETSGVQLERAQLLRIRAAFHCYLRDNSDKFLCHGMQYQGQRDHSGAGAAVKRIIVSFGSVSLLILLPCYVSHA